MSRVRFQFSLLAVLITVAGCAATADLSAPTTRSSYAQTSPDSVIARLPTTLAPLLVMASRGLLYTSESDYPFVFVRRSQVSRSPNTALTVAEFRSAFGVPSNTQVETVSLDEFFARHIERVDPFDDVAQALVPRYIRLRETLRASLLQLVIYRVGRIAIGCYILGFDANGDLEGLTTISIET
ncbi:MAG: Nuclease inhibitor-like protein [Gemmatimonadetes bacterium]|nr:Nuclease inhibitor-like protein [Gemmatimonadota bacterium]